MKSGPLSLAYSIADQNFVRTKSLGILNLSLQLAEVLSSRSEIHRLEVFSNSSLREWHGQFAGRPVRCFDHAYATRLGRMLWDQRQVYAKARQHRVQWLLLPKGFSSFCLKPRIKVAAYVHDAIGDCYSRRYPGAVSRSEAWYFRQSLLATLRHATVIFTNSDFTRRELLALSERHAIRPSEIVVAGIGFHPVKTPPPGDRSRIVVLASPWPHKRTDLALQFMTAWQRTTDFAGRIHWVGRFPSGLRQPTDRQWESHERLDELAYRSLVAESKAVVYFSEYEGFGMPPVEAVLHGACPVYSAIPATREIMRGAGAPFENTSFESFAAAMRNALQMSPLELVSVAQRLLLRHNWCAVADRIIGTLTSHSPSGSTL
jgi:glycosyltransferase involved in cell wall biosynthesis